MLTEKRNIIGFGEVFAFIPNRCLLRRIKAHLNTISRKFHSSLILGQRYIHQFNRDQVISLLHGLILSAYIRNYQRLVLEATPINVIACESFQSGFPSGFNFSNLHLSLFLTRELYRI